MSEDQGGEVEVPKVGPLNKKVALAVGGAVVVFVGWRWVSARKAAAAAAADPGTTDPGYQDPGTIPTVAGADTSSGSGGLAYGNPSPVAPTLGDYGFSGTTNAQWTEYAANQLTQSQSWDYGSIVSALGQYLNHRPLSTDQVNIVQAAIAVAGYPPVGSFTITPGGDTGITVAPSGLQVTGQTDTSVTVTWLPVAGAHGYRADAHSTHVDVSGTQATITGLHPGTGYSVTVAAEAGNGSLGPASDPVSAHTLAAKAPTPPPGKGGKPPRGGGKHYPARKQWHIKVPGESYASIAHKLAPGESAEELWAYQSNPAAGHSRGAAAKLHAQTVHKILNGQAIAIPYPK